MNAAPIRDRTGIGLKPAADDLQQRRLAISVTAHNADPLALMDTYGEVVENFLVRPLVRETNENPH